MKPLGNWSVTSTPVALSGPMLVTTSVNVTFAPMFGLELFTDLFKLRSDEGTGVVVGIFVGVLVGVLV